MKTVALYLPQYHTIPENDEWWGKGYTEWTAVKSGKPLYNKHIQPRVPLNNNYYDLSDVTGSTWQWQAKLAKQNGIDVFCVYHYWFGKDDMLLEKPMEILRNHQEIDIEYCICWANESWARNWYGQYNTILKEQRYEGNEDYKNHFRYLLRFFTDPRYLKIDGRPVINIYRTQDIPDLVKIRNLWDKLAKENGFNGVYVVSARKGNFPVDEREDAIDAYYTFEPGYTQSYKEKSYEILTEKIRTVFVKCWNSLLRAQKLEHRVDATRVYRRMYDEMIHLKKPVFPGSFVMWDNTPRRGCKGSVFVNTSPKAFYDSLKYIKANAKNHGYDDSFLYINAWNEWGEGCYLEPDEQTGYEYLKAVKDVFRE